MSFGTSRLARQVTKASQIMTLTWLFSLFFRFFSLFWFNKGSKLPKSVKYLGGSKSLVTCWFFCVKVNTILQCIIFIKYYIQNAKSSTIELFVIIRKRAITLELRKALQKNTWKNDRNRTLEHKLKFAQLRNNRLLLFTITWWRYMVRGRIYTET